MKICIATKQYPPESIGGIGTYSYNLAHELSNAGHDVHVISSSVDKDCEVFDRKVIVHRIKLKKIRFSWRIEKLLPLDTVLYSIAVAKKINELLSKKLIDIVEFPNWGAEGFWFLMRKRKLPVVIRLHTPHFESLLISGLKETLRDRIMCWLEKKAVIKSDLLVCSTFAHREMIADKYNLDSEAIKVIPLGIMNAELDNKDIYPVESSFNDKLSVLYVSRLEKRKGIDNLLSVIPQVLEAIPNAECVIIGSDYKDRKKKLFISQTGNAYLSRVHFLGCVDNKELEQYYRDCDVFVVPSVYESFGLVYLEAMKYGKPVIGGNAGGIPEVIKDGENGILVKPNDNKALLNSLLALLQYKETRDRLGRNALNSFRDKFTAEKMARKTIDVYSALLNN